LTYTGYLRCRFNQGGKELRSVGQFLQSSQTPNFQPYFSVTRKQFRREFQISREHIASMIEIGHFDMDEPISLPVIDGEETSIELYFDASDSFLVSGFPRTLMVEDSTLQSKSSKQDSCYYTNVCCSLPPISYDPLSVLFTDILGRQCPEGFSNKGSQTCPLVSQPTRGYSDLLTSKHCKGLLALLSWTFRSCELAWSLGISLFPAIEFSPLMHRQ
jgi:hypothetical protein